MQFASFTFVFLFLPITMALYYLTPHRWKQEAGLGISLLFLCSGSWLAALVEILLAAAAYGAGLLLEKQRFRRGLSRLLLFGIIVLQFGALLILRSDWLRSWNTGLFSGKELFPLGLSFLFCRQLDTVLTYTAESVHVKPIGEALDFICSFIRGCLWVQSCPITQLSEHCRKRILILHRLAAACFVSLWGWRKNWCLLTGL